MNEVILRALKPSDAVRIALLANDQRIAYNLRDHFPYPYTLKDAEQFIDKMVRDKNPQEVFGISFKGQLAGAIGIHPFGDIYRKSAEIGYWLGIDYWGQGIMTQAIPLILDYGFDVLKLHRIQAGVIGFNRASMRVLEKCGFPLEGIRKEHAFKHGAFHDEYIYAIIRE